MKKNRFQIKPFLSGAFGRFLVPALLALIFCVGIMPSIVAATCMDLDDTPLDTMEQAAPGIIMFVVDDSGSMDFSTMLKGEPNGYFRPGDTSYAHIFADAGEDYSSYGHLENSGTYANYYRLQMANFMVGDENKGNRIYYDPTATYNPWPQCPYGDANLNTPKADPYKNYTLDLNETYSDFGQAGGGELSSQDIIQAGGVIVDNSDVAGNAITEIVIDQGDPGYQETGSWGNSGANNEHDGESRWTDTVGSYCTWTPTIPETGSYKVFIWYTTTGNRDAHARYTVHHANGDYGFERDQDVNAGGWVEIDDFDFNAGADGYIRVERHAGSTGNSTSADAVRLVPQFTIPQTSLFERSSGWSESTAGGYPDTNDQNYLYTSGGDRTYWATWTASNLDTSETYNVYARWYGGGNSRLTDVHYKTYDNNIEIDDTPVNQREDHEVWTLIAEDVSFSSGTGVVKIDRYTGNSGMCADAVAFMPVVETVDLNLIRAHYYVQSGGDVYLVNLDGDHAYFLVDDDDNDGIVDGPDELESLTDGEADDAGIITGLSYQEERQNFANWYTYYRKRHLTAKNAIGNVINDMQGVYIGLNYINSGLQSHILPLRVEINEVSYDESADLLDTLYNVTPNGGTPLRSGLNAAGRYFQGNPVPGSFPVGTFSSASYPFYSDSSGTCQQAFAIVMTDGFYNGTYSGVNNADGDDNTDFDGTPYGDTHSNTLADIAMHYYETDLQGDINDNVPINSKDTNNRQHMVTYSLSFGLDGDITQSDYADCPFEDCPAWPQPSANQPSTIDDLWHASVNGRGKYVSASSPQEMVEAMNELRQDIESRLGSSAALATNSIQRQVGTVIYQGTYNTAGWFGEVKALELDDIGTDDYKWKASDGIPDWAQRNIISFDGSSSINFAYDALTTQQIALLGNNGHNVEDLVNFLRGDRSEDQSNGGPFRIRANPIGDIVHSAPFYYKGEVYIGANDGMLHAVSAVTGDEVFCYIPNMVYDHLSDLALLGYSHRYYVDSTATAAVVNGKDILVCGLGKGGKGYFGLNITSPGSPVALWEYTGDDDLGYSFSRANIINTEEGRVVMFGNGYDSVSETAALFFVDPEDGTLIAKLDTEITGCNGLCTPSAVDVDADGYMDFVYAGDFYGNLWKFDIRGEKADWKVYYNDGSPQPLITVKNAAGDIQPITAAPEVMLDCAKSDFAKKGAGLMVIFGTGQYLNAEDFDDNTVQSFYGVWDWGDIQENVSSYSDAKGKYLGDLGTDRSLSNVSASLQEQTMTVIDGDWVMMSNNPVNWYDPEENTGEHMGWFMDMTGMGERGVRSPAILEAGALELISIMPSSSPCESGGSSVLYRVSPCTGGFTNDPEFDVNGDGKIDDDDKTIDAAAYFDPSADYNNDGVVDDEDLQTFLNYTDWNNDGYIDSNDLDVMTLPPSGMQLDDMIFEGIDIGDQRYYSDTQGDINAVQTVPVKLGMQYWRVIQ